MLAHAGGIERFSGERRPHEYHGTGCALASAIAARLARGEDLVDAVAGGRDYLRLCLDSAEPGKGAAWVLGFPPDNPEKIHHRDTEKKLKIKN